MLGPVAVSNAFHHNFRHAVYQLELRVHRLFITAGLRKSFQRIADFGIIAAGLRRDSIHGMRQAHAFLLAKLR